MVGRPGPLRCARNIGSAVPEPSCAAGILWRRSHTCFIPADGTGFALTPVQMTSPAEHDMRVLLQHNVGFDDSPRWVDYARSHGFSPVKATRVERCPDCSGSPGPRTWGQYVYYSTLIHLLECADCGLVWADAHIDPATIRGHFEVAYKDDEYFRVSRRPIFDHLVGVIDEVAPRDARVLDIGGARGDLMAQLVARRPDVGVVVNDISAAATDWVAANRGFATLTGGADALASHRERYDVVVLSDVLYYESQLRVLWDALSRLVAPGGSIVIRVPNKRVPIALGQMAYRLTRARSRRALQDRIPFFNPEHIFLFRQQYLRRRLHSAGFTEVQALPSPLLAGRTSAATGSALFILASGVNRLLGHTLVLTPAMVVVGRRAPA
jgi:2-polyprenyl-3-methyl-5-hydroxy-6-metoxy-1,4-benzoquinol methylase